MIDDMSLPQVGQSMDSRFEREAQLVAEMLRLSRLVVMYGAAGAGKTRLLKDWLMPSLARPAGSQHVVYFDAWDESPLATLNVAIEKALPPRITTQADTPLLRYGPWVERLRAWTREPGQRLVLILDHFERYLAMPKGTESEAFAREWASVVATPKLPVCFLVALRADAEPLMTEQFRERIASLDENRIVLPPLLAGRGPTSEEPPVLERPAQRRKRAAVPAAMDAQAPEEAPAREAPGRAPAAETPAGDAPPEDVLVHGVDNLRPIQSHPARMRPRHEASAEFAATPPRRKAPIEPSRHGLPIEPAPPRKGPIEPAPLNDALKDDFFTAPLDDPLAGETFYDDEDFVARRRRPHWLTILAGVAAALVFSAIFFFPGPNDFRLPRRAQVAASQAPAQATSPSAGVASTDPAAGPGSSRERGEAVIQPQRSGATPQGAAGSVAPTPTPAPQSRTTTPPALAAVPSANTGSAPLGAAATPATVASVTVPSPATATTRQVSVGNNDATGAAALASDIGLVLASADGLRVSPVQTEVSSAAAAGKSVSGPELSIARYDVLDSLRWEDEANSRYAEAMRLLVPLRVDPIYFAVRRDDPIAFVHEITGRKINFGANGTDAAAGAADLYQRMFRAQIAPQRASFLGDAEALHALVQDRSVDVVVLVGQAGMNAMLAQQRQTPGAFKLLAFNGADATAKRALRAYVSIVVPPVDNATFLTRDLATLGVMSFLVGRGVSDDVAGRVVRALCPELPRLRATGHPYLHDASPVQVHSAGLRYAAAAERELRACDVRRPSSQQKLDAGAAPPPVASRLDNKPGVGR